jgi:hypothetical protein
MYISPELPAHEEPEGKRRRIYCIKWQSRRTGGTGYTEFQFDTLQGAKEKVAELNESDSKFVHYIQEQDGTGKITAEY